METCSHIDDVIDPSVILVYLRQPDNSNPNESRDDPYWEFGSFGCTGCHSHNLMSLKKLEELRGCRLAFVQGGRGEIRLVYLTPRVDIRYHLHRGEVVWQPPEMPFTFKSAPILVNNECQSDVPSVFDLLDNVHRSTPCGKFASKFRSRRKPLPAYVAQELTNVCQQFSNSKAPRAKSYVEALPYAPPKIDRERRKSYKEHVAFSNATHSRRRISSFKKTTGCTKTRKFTKSC